MPNQELPPVIIALDVSSTTRAHDIMTAIDDYDRSHIALQFRASRLMAEGDALIQDAQEADWDVIVATRFGDEPRKLTLDLDTFITDSETNPFAITLEPPANANGNAEELALAISRVHGLGVLTIGFSRSDRFHPSDHDHIAETDYAAWKRGRELGIRASEVAFNGLQGFYESIASYEVSPDDGPLVVVSKILDADSSMKSLNPDKDTIRVNANKAYRSGASTVLLGDSIVRATNPSMILDLVLDAHDRK